MRKFRLFSFAWLKMSQWSCTLRCQGLFLLLLLVSGWLLHGIRSSRGFGLGLTSRKWRLNTNKQKKMQNCRTTLWARLCIAVISLSLFFPSFWSEMGHKTSILISRCRGVSTGPSWPWPGMKSSSRPAEVRESRDGDPLSSYGFYPASCPLALLWKFLN